MKNYNLARLNVHNTKVTNPVCLPDFKKGKAFCKYAQKQLYVFQEYENEGNARDVHSSMLCHHFMNYKIPADKTARDLH
jgi:hypothetical protein